MAVAQASYVEIYTNGWFNTAGTVAEYTAILSGGWWVGLDDVVTTSISLVASAYSPIVVKYGIKNDLKLITQCIA